MTIEKVDEWLKEQFGISYSDLTDEFKNACKMINCKNGEIKHLNDLLDSSLKEVEELRDICHNQ